MQQKIFNLRINVYLSIFVALVLLIFLHSVGILRPVENGLLYLIRPVEKVLYRSGIKIFDSKNLTKEELERENEELKNRLSSSLMENARLHSLISKSENLQKELEFLESKNFQAVTAQIIGKVSESTAQIYILDRGKNNGVQIGFSVIYLNGIMVGKIIALDDLTSQMMIINDSNSAVGAQVQNETSSPGVVIGKLGLSLEMQLIPQSEEVLENQIVVTSGLEENIPSGLVIGQITEIHKKTEELFQTAILESPIALERLNVVSIIIP